MAKAVAVAGGSAGLGRSIIDELRSNTSYEAIILTLTEAKPDLVEKLRCRVVRVDYNDVEALTRVLERYHVHTVISTINSLDNTQPELALMRAADLSVVTKRYIPSIWGSFDYGNEYDSISLGSYAYANLLVPIRQAKVVPVVQAKLDVIRELRQTSSIEYTVVYNGYFLDYYGNDHVKSYLKRIPIVIDVAHSTAAIPGSGNTPVVFTHSLTVAQFVVALLGRSRWPQKSWIIGDKVTWNEFLRLAEDAKGEKFTVHYDSISTLKSGKITELPGQQSLYEFWPKKDFQWVEANFGIWFDQGLFDLRPNQTLNDVFPDIKPITVKELLERSWKTQ